MDTFIAVLLFAAGLALIIKGGDFFVDAAIWLADITGIPKFIVGATVVSVATTMPEMTVSFIAVYQGKNDIGIGNCLGSVIANIGLILAISCLFMPLVINRKEYAARFTIHGLALVLLFLFCLNGTLSLYESIILLLLLCVFFYLNIKSIPKKNEEEKNRQKPKGTTIIINLVKFAAGLAGIIIGANFMVDNGVIIATALGMSEKFIGLTIIAVGTSLPELITTVNALIKKEAAMSVGNIIGANIMNLTIILPVCSIMSAGGLPVDKQTLTFDFPATILLTAVALVIPMLISKFKRWQGGLILAIYISYIVFIAVR